MHLEGFGFEHKGTEISLITDPEPAAVEGDADDQLSKIASSIPPVDPSCVELKHSAFLAQLLLEEVDLESTSEKLLLLRNLSCICSVLA